MTDPTSAFAFASELGLAKGYHQPRLTVKTWQAAREDDMLPSQVNIGPERNESLCEADSAAREQPTAQLVLHRPGCAVSLDPATGRNHP